MTDDALQGVVVSGTGGAWRVLAGNGVEVEASMRGRLKKSDTGRRADGSIRRDTVASRVGRLKLAVGDHVRVEQDEIGGAWAICEILPRKSQFARREPGHGKGERIIAANLDQAIVMFAAANPEPHRRMLDRFLVIAEANGISSIIVINKVELVGEATAHSRFSDYERAGYTVHYTSVKQRIGLDGVRTALSGRVSVISGPSGVGKSSILNALFPGLGLRVSEISESVNKGRHTTVGAFLHPLPAPDIGAVVDTPGLREVGMWGLPHTRLDDCFPEIHALRDDCKFRDCGHGAEPGCAVRNAVKQGTVSTERFESYSMLKAELAAEQTN
ncbi:MAG TPA: ribosome small subunit-dependent GTPase A [Gemmatimonadaceae bacterium]